MCQQAFDHLHTYLNNAIPFSEPTVFCSNTVGINLQNKRNVNILEALELRLLLPIVNPVLVL